MTKLTGYPYYEAGRPPRYYRYHQEVDFLDELELIWGKRWGAQGIGRLREVAVIRPTEVEVDPLFEEDPAYFMFDGTVPDLKLMQEEHGQEVPREEQIRYFPCNFVTLEPRRIMMIQGPEKTIKALREEGVEVIEVPYSEVLKYGGGLRCTTMQLVRDPGPRLW